MYIISIGPAPVLVGDDPHFSYIAAYVNKQAVTKFFAKYETARHQYEEAQRLVPVEINPEHK